MCRNPVVSIIIIFLNAVEFLQESIDSVLAQTYEGWELLLVDDGSTDGSTEMARSYAARQPGRIFYLEHEQHRNLGMSSSRNLGIRRARGSYIAFLDADDYWLPDRLGTHVRILEANPTVGMLYGSTKYWFSWTGRPEDAGRDHLSERRTHSDTLFYPPELLPLFIEGKVEVPSTCSILVRSDVANEVGGFEDSFRGMYEDQAFYVKVCLSTNVLAVNDCLAWYRQHPMSNVSVSTQSNQAHSLHYSFLKWVESFCQSKMVTDTRVLLAVRRQLWLYNTEHHVLFPFLSSKRLRWVKKWLLHVEERILPARVHDWLWIRKQMAG